MRRVASTSSRDQTVSSPFVEDDEKAGKLRQRDQNRAVQVMLFLGILSVIFLVAIVKLHHTPNKRSMRHGFNKNVVQSQKTPLPPNSIYRLSVENSSGKQESLEQFVGMVSLVVNVASL